MRRPITWVGDRMPPFEPALPAPPKHEWLELVKYWNGGGRAPVWFVADPLRSDLALVRYAGRPTLYRWPLESPVLIGGVRPNEMDWHTIPPPDWYLGEGWALTPETAGIAREDRPRSRIRADHRLDPPLGAAVDADGRRPESGHRRRSRRSVRVSRRRRRRRRGRRVSPGSSCACIALPAQARATGGLRDRDHIVR